MRTRPRVAVVHYWLVGMRGGERVLERVLRLFPEADLFTHVYDPAAVSDTIRAHKVRTTFIDRLPFSRKLYKKYLPVMPMALESLDLTDYDLVLSFEAGPAKGVVASPEALHVCYCHSPMRYLWDAYPEYRASAGLISRLFMSLTFPNLRMWDHATAARVDGFIANSRFIQKRIRRAYRRASTVVYPPAPVEQFQATPTAKGAYLWVGQMTPYKRADIAVEAFNQLGLPLHVIGKGEMRKRLASIAGPNISFTEKLSFAELIRAYSECRGLIFTAEEDFGIIPVEVMASGRPVLAFGKGGALETIAEGRTGQFFYDQTAESLVEALRRFEAWLPEFRPADAVAQASKFSGDRFDLAYLTAVRDFASDTPAIKDYIDDIIEQRSPNLERAAS
jgi:glycosyltransferase involved in cell wall biosynthesis